MAAANGLLTLVSDTTDPDQIANPYKAARWWRWRRGKRIAGANVRLEVEGARSRAMGVDRRLFEHRRRGDPQAQRMTGIESTTDEATFVLKIAVFEAEDLPHLRFRR
jgi:hypothetical protein